MDTLTKLRTVSSEMGLEPAEEISAVGARAAAGGRMAVMGERKASPLQPPCGHPVAKAKNNALAFHAKMPGGKTVALLKTLLTSACERDCFYCPFRAGRDFRRATLKPEEMANVFSELNRAGTVDGMFLSSGIAGGGARTQDRLLDSIDILRREHHFNGYVHLKIMPGAEKDQVFRAMQLADRVSINLEAPNAERLPKLAPHKIFFDELLQPLRWADEIRRAQSPMMGWKEKWPSLVTQFVVGGAGESDLEILSTTAYLTKQLRLARAYYSAFRPVLNTPLENLPPENPMREYRLYQSSFLLRDYGFDLEDMPFAESGNLPLDVDPKAAWATRNLADSPVELNRADRRSLLRVPGIGPKTADALLAARKRGALRDLHDLKALGVAAARAAPYVLLEGKRPPQQLSLF